MIIKPKRSIKINHKTKNKKNSSKKSKKKQHRLKIFKNKILRGSGKYQFKNGNASKKLLRKKTQKKLKKLKNLKKQKRTQKGGLKFFGKKPMMPLGGPKGPLAGPIKSTKSIFQKTKSLRPTGFKKTKQQRLQKSSQKLQKQTTHIAEAKRIHAEKATQIKNLTKQLIGKNIPDKQRKKLEKKIHSAEKVQKAQMKRQEKSVKKMKREMDKVDKIQKKLSDRQAKKTKKYQKYSNSVTRAKDLENRISASSGLKKLRLKAKLSMVKNQKSYQRGTKLLGKGDPSGASKIGSMSSNQIVQQMLKGKKTGTGHRSAELELATQMKKDPITGKAVGVIAKQFEGARATMNAATKGPGKLVASTTAQTAHNVMREATEKGKGPPGGQPAPEAQAQGVGQGTGAPATGQPGATPPPPGAQGVGQGTRAPAQGAATGAPAPGPAQGTGAQRKPTKQGIKEFYKKQKEELKKSKRDIKNNKKMSKKEKKRELKKLKAERKILRSSFKRLLMEV